MTAISNRSAGANFFFHARLFPVTINREKREVFGIHTEDATGFEETSDERKQARTGMIRVQSSDFPGGVPSGAVFTVNGCEWYVTEPAGADGGLIHVRVKTASIQRSEGRFKR